MSLATVARRVREQASWRRPRLVAKGRPRGGDRPGGAAPIRASSPSTRLTMYWRPRTAPAEHLPRSNRPRPPRPDPAASGQDRRGRHSPSSDRPGRVADVLRGAYDDASMLARLLRPRPPRRSCGQRTCRERVMMTCRMLTGGGARAAARARGPAPEGSASPGHPDRGAAAVRSRPWGRSRRPPCTATATSAPAPASSR